MANKLWPKAPVTLPGLITRADAPDTPAHNVYGSNPQPQYGGPTAAPTNVPSGPKGSPQAPVANFYEGGTPVMDADDLAIQQELHNDALRWTNASAARPLTPDQARVVNACAASGCTICNPLIYGMRRAVVGMKIRAQQAEAAAAARNRR